MLAIFEWQLTSMGGIVYAIVARGPSILAEHASCTGNFSSGRDSRSREVPGRCEPHGVGMPVTQAILEKIPPNNSKLTYVYDKYCISPCLLLKRCQW